jgi:hypothetical protein
MGKAKTVIIPNSMQVLLSKLFGATSAKAKSDSLSESTYREYLSKIVDELYLYLDENVQTDELHRLMLLSGLVAAKESLNDENYQAGFIEGLTRFSLVLMGDYPDHRKRKGGRKNSEHYKLNLHRSLNFVQDYEQKFRTILAVGNTGFPELSTNPYVALDRFRDEYGSRATHREFVEWYRKNYPIDYAILF